MGFIQNERVSVIRSIVKTLFHRQQYRRGDNVLALDNREWYAFVINNRDRLKEVFREVKARNLEENLKYKQLSLDLGDMEMFYKEREFRIPLSEVYRVDSLRSDLKGKYLSAGKLTLVPVSDKRPEVSVNTVNDEFMED